MNYTRLGISIVVGAVLAFIASRVLFIGSGLTLIPWALVGLLIGWSSKDRKEGMVNGATFGLVLSFIFLLTGYEGAASAYTHWAFFLLLSAFGAFCGLVLGLLGFTAKLEVQKKK